MDSVAFRPSAPPLALAIRQKDDYSQMLVDLGLDDTSLARMAAVTEDRIPMPEGWAWPFEIKPSPIHGEGVFATEPLAVGARVGPVRIGLNRTPLGYLTNHSGTPNAITCGREDGGGDLVTLRAIAEGEEITIDYRQAVREAGRAETWALNTQGVRGAWGRLGALIDNKANRVEIRDAIGAVKDELLKLPQADHGLEHLFCDGLYIRVARIQKGTLFVTPFYREECILTMLEGRLLIVSEDGPRGISPPDFVITRPGVQRLILAMEDVLAHTVHPNPTNERDIEVLEHRIYAQTFEDVPLKTLEGGPL